LVAAAVILVAADDTFVAADDTFVAADDTLVAAVAGVTFVFDAVLVDFPGVDFLAVVLVVFFAATLFFAPVAFLRLEPAVERRAADRVIVFVGTDPSPRVDQLRVDLFHN